MTTNKRKRRPLVQRRIDEVHPPPTQPVRPFMWVYDKLYPSIDVIDANGAILIVMLIEGTGTPNERRLAGELLVERACMRWPE